MDYVVPLLSFDKEVFGIKYPCKVDMPIKTTKNLEKRKNRQ